MELRLCWNGTKTTLEWSQDYTRMELWLYWNETRTTLDWNWNCIETGTILEWDWNCHPYLEQGEGGSSEKDDGEEHNDESGGVQHSDQLSRAKRFPLFTEIQGKGIRNSTSQT